MELHEGGDAKSSAGSFGLVDRYPSCCGIQKYSTPLQLTPRFTITRSIRDISHGIISERVVGTYIECICDSTLRPGFVRKSLVYS